mmetsp:Transcript_14435/g.36889  ORF Transcript_14435/g.36889 Transcript_14435/m.36889 type:complete len:87 (+) Transcript_14435:875-1135(+)
MASSPVPEIDALKEAPSPPPPSDAKAEEPSKRPKIAGGKLRLKGVSKKNKTDAKKDKPPATPADYSAEAQLDKRAKKKSDRYCMYT